MGQKMCPTEKRKMASSFEHLLDFGIVLTKLKTGIKTKPTKKEYFREMNKWAEQL